MNGLDLFSGIGGIGLALKPWVRTISYCEQDRYAQGVLLSRMQSGDIDTAPIWDDIRTLTGEMLPSIDIIFGGFPCQDISVAGAGKGLAGERSGLFYEIIRLAKEIRPSFVFLENVPAIRTRGLEQVIKAFTEIGYDCRWTCLSAASVGAPHKRERWFLLANASGERRQQVARGTHGDESQNEGWSAKEVHQPERDGQGSGARSLANTSSEGLQIRGQPEFATISSKTPTRMESEFKRRCFTSNSMCSGLQGNWCSSRIQSQHSAAQCACWWTTESSVGRVANGIQRRVDRIKCLGNSVVPLQVNTAFKKLMGLR